MSRGQRPHPKNVSGDFYVVDGCCMFCGIPDATAPGLFAWDDMHCFVARQPTTPHEIESMLDAMTSSEVDCIRYRGQVADIVRSTVECGNGHLLDLPPPPHLREVFRTHACFDLTGEFASSPIIEAVAENLEAHLRRIPDSPHLNYRIVGVRMVSGVATLAYGWSEELHTIEVLKPQRANVSCLVRHSSVVRLGTRAVSRMLDAWLRSGPFHNIRWHTKDEWDQGGLGQESPF